jgi:hypothetical protein
MADSRSNWKSASKKLTKQGRLGAVMRVWQPTGTSAESGSTVPRAQFGMLQPAGLPLRRYQSDKVALMRSRPQHHKALHGSTETRNEDQQRIDSDTSDNADDSSYTTTTYSAPNPRTMQSPWWKDLWGAGISHEQADYVSLGFDFCKSVSSRP